MTLTFQEVNPNDPAEFVDNQTTAVDGTVVTVVKDYRMDYLIEVLTDDIVNRKTAANDTTPICAADFPKTIPAALTANLAGGAYEPYVDRFVIILGNLKRRKTTHPAAVNAIETRLQNVLARLQSDNSNKATVTKLLVNMLLKDAGSAKANQAEFTNYIVAPTGVSPLTPPLYYDEAVRSVGFPINVIKWRYSSLKSAAEALVKKESLDFDSLFNPVKSSVGVNADVVFVNVNGKLVKRYKDGRADEPYDLDTMVRNAQNIQNETCNSLGLAGNNCDEFFKKCQKDSMDDCNTFMKGLSEPGFLNLVKNLKFVNPLHVTWVIKKFSWPSYVKNGVRSLRSTNQWLNPNNYTDKAEADLMKKIRNNNMLVAFFDAVKATTDAFPAILNPNYTGDGVNNPFALQVSKSKVGRFGLKALMNQNPLSLSEYKVAFLKAQNMISNNMTTLASVLGIRGLMPSSFRVGPLVGGPLLGGPLFGGAGEDESLNPRIQEVINKLSSDRGTGFVPSADYTRSLWNGLMTNLHTQFGMDVSAIDMEVSDYIKNWKDYEARAHRAMAYVKVYRDKLAEDEQNGITTSHPYALTRSVLEDLTDVRDKLATKTSSKTTTFFRNVFELLDRLESKLANKN